jgi:hypothetical protein
MPYRSLLPPIVRRNPESGEYLPYDLSELAIKAESIASQMDREAAAVGYSRFAAWMMLESGFDKQTGLDWAKLTGADPEVSDTEAIVLWGALGIPTTEMLPIAEYTRRLAKAAGLKDEFGRDLPVILIGTPGAKFQERLSRSQKADLRDGDMGVIGREGIELVSRLMPQPCGSHQPIKLHNIGCSLGTAGAASGSEYTPQYGLKVRSLILGSTPHVVNRRSRLELFRSFVIESQDSQYPPGTPRVFTFGSASPAKYWKEVLAAGNLYLGVLAGVASNSIETSVVVAHRRNSVDSDGMKVKFGGGMKDRIGLHKPTLGIVARLSGLFRPDVDAMFAEEERHTWPRDLHLLGAFLLHALATGSKRTSQSNAGLAPELAVVPDRLRGA